jgi:hypothetical protein
MLRKDLTYFDVSRALRAGVSLPSHGSVRQFKLRVVKKLNAVLLQMGLVIDTLTLVGPSRVSLLSIGITGSD